MTDFPFFALSDEHVMLRDTVREIADDKIAPHAAEVDARAEFPHAAYDALRAADPGNTAPVPADLVTASASGLDPHISPAAAAYQIGRVARARGVPTGRIEKLVAEATEGRTFGILGEARVNVLRLNLALDKP